MTKHAPPPPKKPNDIFTNKYIFFNIQQLPRNSRIQVIQLPSHKLSKAILKCREMVQKLAIQLPVSQFNNNTIGGGYSSEVGGGHLMTEGSAV